MAEHKNKLFNFQKIGDIGSVIGGASAVGQLFDNITGGSLSRSKELAAYQTQLALDAWKQQQQYNSPINQVQRLKDAGLNPSLMYDGIHADTGNASSPPDVGNVSQSMQAVTGMQQSQLQAALGAAQIAQTKAQTDLLREQATKQKTENSYLDQLYEGQIELNGVTIQLTQEQIPRTRNEAKLLLHEAENAQATHEMIVEQTAKLLHHFQR